MCDNPFLYPMLDTLSDVGYPIRCRIPYSYTRCWIPYPQVWSKPPISMEFQVPMLAASGLHVRFLKIHEKSNYNTIKWVRYISKNGTYLRRI